MTSKTLTADDILNESDDSSNSESSSSDSGKKKPKEVVKLKEKQAEPKDTIESKKGVKAETEPGFEVIEPNPVNPYQPKSASPNDSFVAKLAQHVKEVVGESLDGVANAVNDTLFNKDKSKEGGGSDNEADQTRPTREKLRAYQAQAFRSFTAGVSIEQKQMTLIGVKDGEKKQSKVIEDEPVSEEEKARILRMIEQEDSDEDNSNDDASSDQQQDIAVKTSTSIVSDQDLLNRSLESETEEVICATNYLRYASEKVNAKFDLLEVIDKNERSFKQVAEKMITQSSQLVTNEQVTDMPATQRRLTHTKLFSKIAERFHGDINVAQGVPYSIAAVEDFIAIGSSDGSVRLFDHSEQEIKTLIDKSVQSNGVTCLDIKRVDKSQNIFVVSGHVKGHIAIYELKGLFPQHQAAERQQNKTGFQDLADNLFGNVSSKHLKTLDDMHKTTVVQVKFIGDYKKEILVISCDLTGVVYLTQFEDGVFLFKANKQCLMKKRLGACYSLAPLIQIGASWKSDDVSNVMTKKVGNQIQNKLQEQIRQQQLLQQQQQVQQQLSQSQLIGFGSLDEVYVAQIMPSAIPLISIRRPSYIQAGTVPYLDWGNALTPTFRDQAYPVLAIAWGRTIQLAVYHNQREVMLGRDTPQLQLDGFYICDSFSIDSIFFLSESLLFIIVNKKEVRILYTQNFTPGVFDQNYSQQDMKTRKVGADSQAEDEQAVIQQFTMTVEKYAGSVSVYAERDCGYRMIDEEIRHKDNSAMMEPGEQRSKFNFNATVCKNFDFNVIVLGKTQIGQRNLIHWEEYLDLIRRTNPDDWLKVLRAALEIFNGKMVGLAGLPDAKQKRESLLRQRMKDLLRENIDACIREFQEGECVSTKTLRVATEFCIRVGAIDHVFGELFNMFAEAGVEQRYFENLDAFILSGKLKHVKIPNKILDRLISFYRSKDVELLEKAILNLDLSKYPDSQSVRMICEEEFLSSALIHLLTTLFEEEQDMPTTTCLSILCALFNLMIRSKFNKTRQDVMSLLVYLENFGTSIFELSSSDSQKIQDEKKQEMFKKSRALKLDIERSSTYIGYKLLWVITLFLEGKKFPQGSLSSDKWRYYVYDIVRFCTNEKFMAWFLEFDCQTFFQILKKLFNDPEPSEYIRSQEAFITANKGKNPFLEPCFTHLQIITIVEHKVDTIIREEHENNGGQPTEKSELLANAMLFFLTQVCRNTKIPATKELCLRTTHSQILFHKKLFNLPKQELMELIPDTQAARKEKDRTCNIYTYLIRRNEKDIIALLVRFQNELSKEEIESLIEQVQSAPLFKLKIFLYQLQGDFQKCLTLFFKVKAIKSELFAWLSDVQSNLTQSQQIGEQTNDEDDNSNSNFFDIRGVPSRISYKKMKELINQNIGDFVSMDPEQTVKICDQWFDKDYMRVADELKDHKELAFSFLSTVLLQHESEIMKEYEASVMANSTEGISPSNKDLLLRLIEILCDRKLKQSSVSVVDYVSKSYFPIDDCLKICESKKSIEACAVLYRRKGNYKKSLKLYIDTMVNLCVQKLIHTIFVEKHIRFEDPLCTNEHMQTFDQLIQQMVKICDKYGSRLPDEEMEDLWLFAIKGLFEVKNEVYKIQLSNENSESESDSDREQEKIEERHHFEKFLLIRNQTFMQKMAENVNLRKVIQFLNVHEPQMKYSEFEETFVRKLKKETIQVNVLLNAKGLALKECQEDTHQHISLLVRGFTSTSQKCESCKSKLTNKWDSQEVWMMPCDHSFHARCIAKSDGQCPICFNSLEILHSFQQIKKQSIKGSRRDSRSSGNSTQDDEHSISAIKERRQFALKNSIARANQKRKVFSKAEKIQKLMHQFDKDQGDSLLSRADFYF